MDAIAIAIYVCAAIAIYVRARTVPGRKPGVAGGNAMQRERVDALAVMNVVHTTCPGLKQLAITQSVSDT